MVVFHIYLFVFLFVHNDAFMTINYRVSPVFYHWQPIRFAEILKIEPNLIRSGRFSRYRKTITQVNLFLLFGQLRFVRINPLYRLLFGLQCVMRIRDSSTVTTLHKYFFEVVTRLCSWEIVSKLGTHLVVNNFFPL